MKSEILENHKKAVKAVRGTLLGSRFWRLFLDDVNPVTPLNIADQVVALDAFLSPSGWISRAMEGPKKLLKDWEDFCRYHNIPLVEGWEDLCRDLEMPRLEWRGLGRDFGEALKEWRGLCHEFGKALMRPRFVGVSP